MIWVGLILLLLGVGLIAAFGEGLSGGFLCGFILCLVGTLWVGGAGYDDGYRAGQIDAQTGKVEWALRENETGERVWTRVPATQRSE